MKIKNLVLTVTLFAASCMLTAGDTLTGNGTWQTWNPSVLNTSAIVSLGVLPGSGPYWNGTSGDGAAYNIGWCLAGTGNCHISNAPGALSYYGNAGNGSATVASNMYFTTSGATQTVSLLGLFSNQSGSGLPPAGTDYFGWYSISSGAAIGPLTPLLTSAEPVGTTAAFAPTGDYGFYLENVQSPNTSYTASYFWFSNAGLNYATGTGVSDSGTQHFSIFGASGSNTYDLGLEDTVTPNSDFDYNDMIIQLQPAPEPTAGALMAGGIGLLVFALHRRRA